MKPVKRLRAAPRTIPGARCRPYCAAIQRLRLPHSRTIKRRQVALLGNGPTMPRSLKPVLLFGVCQSDAGCRKKKRARGMAAGSPFFETK
uniref:Uncharacterized protein n=1 Tax=Paenibacillus athensensis TaxID=1967502 RepID=A0A4Y8Q0C6_9BACL